MPAISESRAPVEKRAAERLNVYLQFEYRYCGSSGARFEGRGVTINMSKHGAFLLMPAWDLSEGQQVELLFGVEEGDESALLRAFAARPEGGPPWGERLVRTTAIVARVQPLEGFPTSSLDRCGVAVIFVRQSLPHDWKEAAAPAALDFPLSSPVPVD
jgi:hypothetical protein